MSIKITDKITVKREIFDKVVDIVERDGLEEISFEFIVGSCFPKALENIKQALMTEHANGFAEGRKSVEAELFND